MVNETQGSFKFDVEGEGFFWHQAHVLAVREAGLGQCRVKFVKGQGELREQIGRVLCRAACRRCSDFLLQLNHLGWQVREVQKVAATVAACRGVRPTR